MVRGIRTIYPRGLNKGFYSKFQCISPEERRSIQRAKRREYGSKENSSNEINSVNS